MLTANTVRTWYRVHKWSSLVCTGFLLLACITGLPLIFYDEINATLDHTAKPAAVGPNAPDAPVAPMVAVAKQKLPHMFPFTVLWDPDSSRVAVWMSTALDPETKDMKAVVFDRHTGKVLGQEDPAHDLMGQILVLHRELFAGLPGELLMGFMALLFVVALVSGVLVYGPFMRRLDFGTFRRKQPRRVRWFDLHNLIGIVILSWALVVGATGIMNALSEPLFAAWRAQTLPALLAPYRGMPEPQHFISVDAAVESAKRALPKMRISSVMFPNSEISSGRHYLVWTTGKSPMTSRLYTPVLVDVRNGGITAAKGLPWYLRALEVSRPLHFGDYGGMSLKIIWALFTLATIVVLGSGVYLWVSHGKTATEARLDELVLAASASRMGMAQ